MYRRIVVPLDGSSLAEAVLPHATAIAESFKAELHLVQVVREARDLVNLGVLDPVSMGSVAVPDMETLASAVQAQAQHTERYLEEQAAAPRSKGIKVVTAVLLGDPSTQIVKYAQDKGMDLVAISTHGRSGISRMVFGSVAERVVRQGTVPVLLIRP